MISRRRFIAFLGGLAFARTAPGCAWLDDKPVTVAAHVWSGYEPLFLAQREGWLDARRVRLVETRSASDSMKALVNGTVEGAALTLDEALRARGNGVPLSVVMIFDISAGADMLIARAGITCIADLRGRSIGFEQGGVGALMLTEALRSAGLTHGDVKLTPLTIDQHLDAWRRNLVDACITFEPVAGRLLGLGGHNLFDSRRLPDTIVDVLAMRGDLLNRRGNAITVLIQGHFRALEHLWQNPQDAAYRMASHMNLPAAAVLSTFKGMVLPDAANNYRLLTGESPEVLTIARKLSTLMVKNGLLKEEDSMNALILADFLPATLQEQ